MAKGQPRKSTALFPVYGQKEATLMTKSRETTREKLTAKIEDGKKKIQQFENWEKMLRHRSRFPSDRKGSPVACYDKENREKHLPRQNPFQRNEQRNHERQNQASYSE